MLVMPMLRGVCQPQPGPRPPASSCSPADGRRAILPCRHPASLLCHNEGSPTSQGSLSEAAKTQRPCLSPSCWGGTARKAAGRRGARAVAEFSP